MVQLPLAGFRTHCPFLEATSSAQVLRIASPMIPHVEVEAVLDRIRLLLESEQGSLDERLRSLETQLIAAALRAAHGNKSKAAALLKIKRSTLGDRIKKLGVGGVNAIAR